MRLQGFQLLQPQVSFVARGKVEVCTGKGSSRVVREVFRVEVKHQGPAVKAGVQGRLSNVKARSKATVG